MDDFLPFFFVDGYWDLLLALLHTRALLKLTSWPVWSVVGILCMILYDVSEISELPMLSLFSLAIRENYVL